MTKLPLHSRSVNWKTLLAFALLAAVLLFVADTFHWQQVNDPAQLQYACFQMDHGMAPYRDLIEMNMPGIYLVNWTVMHSFGDGALPWRIFDLLLMALAAAAMISIALPYDWFASVLGAALFILFHGRDGAMQTGQRDLIMAVMLLCGCALLFRALRSRTLLPLFGFGLASGIAMTMKPTPVPFVALLLVLTAIHLKRCGQPWLRPILVTASGVLAPLAVVAAFLAYEHALRSFFSVLFLTLPYYETIGRKSWLDLITLLSPSILGLLFLALVFAVLQLARQVRQHRKAFAKTLLQSSDPATWEKSILALFILFGLFSYFGQGKGMVYHRYPLLAFLFLSIAMAITTALKHPGMPRLAGLLGLSYCLVLVPCYLHEIRHTSWNMGYIDALTDDLNQLGGSALNNKVQCLSTEAECATTLYRMRLVQSTGLFYDFLIFGSSSQPAVEQWRTRFWQQMQRNPPDVFIVHVNLYPNRDGFTKLARWPLFQQYLSQHYVFYVDRRFPRNHGLDMEYRLYVRKDHVPAQRNLASVRQP